MQKTASCILFCIVVLDIAIIGSIRIVRLLFLHRVADLVLVAEHEFKIIRPSGMTGDDLRRKSFTFQLLLQFSQRFLGKLVILCKRVDKAVSAVRAEPDSVACKQLFIIYQVHHMSPSVTGHKNAFHLYTVKIKELTVLKQHTLVVRLNHRQLI